MQFIWASNIVYEDIRIGLFMLSLQLEENLSPRNCYEGFPCRIFSSLRKFINAFIMDWDYSVKEQFRNAMSQRIWEEAKLQIIQEKEPKMIFYSSLNILIIRLLHKLKLVYLLLIYQLSQDIQMSYLRYSGMPSRMTMIMLHIMWNGLWLWLQNLVLKKKKMFACNHLFFT